MSFVVMQNNSVIFLTLKDSSHPDDIQEQNFLQETRAFLLLSHEVCHIEQLAVIEVSLTMHSKC